MRDVPYRGGNRLLVSSREPELYIDEELILPDTVENLTRPSADE